MKLQRNTDRKSQHKRWNIFVYTGQINAPRRAIRCLRKYANLLCVLFQKSSSFRILFHFCAMSVKHFEIFVVKVFNGVQWLKHNNRLMIRWKCVESKGKKKTETNRFDKHKWYHHLALSVKQFRWALKINTPTILKFYDTSDVFYVKRE